MDSDNGSRIARRAVAIALGSTIVVVVFKLVAAAVSGSISVLAEGLQSLLDVFMSLLALWALRIAAVPPDREHPYGHGKAELLASAFQMILVIVTAGIIIWQAAIRLNEPRDIDIGWGLYALGYAALANTAVMLHLRRVLKKVNSPVLAGEIEHLRADTLASAGIFAGLIAYSIFDWRPLDALIAIGFTFIGGFFAVRQLRRVIHPLMDGSLPPDDLRKIEEVLAAHPRVLGFHNVQTREVGNNRVVSLHTLLDDDLSFVDAHEIAEQIEDELSVELGGAFVTLHYEPYRAEIRHRELEHGANGDGRTKK